MFVVPYPRDMYPRAEYDIGMTDELSISGPACGERRHTMALSLIRS